MSFYDGKPAGSFGKHGYLKVRVLGKFVANHRVLWALYYGQYPDFFIDHIDGDKANNKRSNLRKSNRRENGSNRESHRNGKLVGAYKTKTGRYRSSLCENKKYYYLGTFDTALEANKAYIEKLRSLK